MKPRQQLPSEEEEPRLERGSSSTSCRRRRSSSDCRGSSAQATWRGSHGPFEQQCAQRRQRAHLNLGEHDVRLHGRQLDSVRRVDEHALELLAAQFTAQSRPARGSTRRRHFSGSCVCRWHAGCAGRALRARQGLRTDFHAGRALLSTALGPSSGGGGGSLARRRSRGGRGLCRRSRLSSSRRLIRCRGRLLVRADAQVPAARTGCGVRWGGRRAQSCRDVSLGAQHRTSLLLHSYVRNATRKVICSARQRRGFLVLPPPSQPASQPAARCGAPCPRPRPLEHAGRARPPARTAPSQPPGPRT